MSPATLIAALAALSGNAGAELFSSGKVIRSSREHCAGCGCPIPPGRAGRRCPECRQKNEDAHQREVALREQFERLHEGQSKR